LANSNHLLLKINNISVSYGKIEALRQVELEVLEGELVTLLGANGAGKSTLVKSILGIQRPREGTIWFMGRDITRSATERIVASGITVVPEGGGVLPLMTVRENLQLGAYHQKSGIQSQLEQVFQRFPILNKRRDQKAGTLSGGEREILSIARAIVAKPKMVIMDEPSLGLAPILVGQLFDIISDLKNEGYTILLAEQNARKALECSDKGYIFEMGKIVLEGTSQALQSDPAVRKAYLGG
jgi:branched-chain amino acid transport system ATP-binding protein